MKQIGLLFLTALLIAVSPHIVSAQSGQEFKDPAGKFKITLLGDWRAISYSDAVGREKTEFVYRDRSEGLLRISRENLGGGTLENKVSQDEESLRISKAGFERATSEAFGGGSLRGIRFSFFSNDGGRRLAATHYYLQDGNAVWVLRFSGRRGSLDTIRNVTDQMARSFSPM